MRRREVSWREARRALLLALGLLLVLVVAGANFALVEVRLLGLRIETRLAWALLGAGALGFAAGTAYARLRPAAGGREDPATGVRPGDR